MKFKNIPSLSRIFASLFRTPKKPAKDWGAQFGYAPASAAELALWNANRTDRAARRRAERERKADRHAGFLVHLANLVKQGEYSQVVHQRSLERAINKGGL